jgi:hypothetical protein
MAPPGSTSKTKPSSKTGDANALQTSIIKLYEDLSYLSILNVETSPEGRIFTCMVSVATVNKSMCIRLIQ